jgi:hypothetical protein
MGRASHAGGRVVELAGVLLGSSDEILKGLVALLGVRDDDVGDVRESGDGGEVLLNVVGQLRERGGDDRVRGRVTRSV